MFKKCQAIYIVDKPDRTISSKISKSLSSLSLSIENIKSPDIKISNFDNNTEIRDEYLNNLPSGTVVGRKYFDEDEGVILLLPLHSSHLSMPLKPGEIFWYFSENDTKLDNKIKKSLLIKNFWVSRVHGMNISENVSFSFYPRDINKIQDINKKSNINKNDLNTSQKQIEKEKAKLLEKSIKPLKYTNDLIDLDSNSDKIISDREFNLKCFKDYFSYYEDFSIQGSNNTLINLGTNIDKRQTNAAIDIVVGRDFIDRKDVEAKK